MANQIVNAPDISIITSPKSSPIGEIGHFVVRSLDSLRLSTGPDGPFGTFGQEISLNKDQLKMLPKSLLERIYAGYSRALNLARMSESPNLGKMTFSVESGNLAFSTLPLEPDAKFRKAMGEVLDRSRVFMPGSVTSAPRSLPSKLCPEVGKPEADTSNLNSGVISDVNSVLRNGTSSFIQASGRVLSAAKALSGSLGGVGSVYIGGTVFTGGLSTYNDAKECGDTEGKFEGRLTMGIGSGISVGGFASVAGTLPSLIPSLNAALAAVPDVVTAITYAGNIGVLLMAGCMLVNSTHSIYHLDKFRTDLTEILERKEIPQQEKAQQGLVFLEQQISITEGEYLALKEKHPSDEKALAIAMEKEVKVKWARLVRRVGEECAFKIADQIGSLKMAVFAGDGDAIIKAVDLLQEVDKASHKAMVKHVIEFLLSLLYLCVGILSFVTPLGLVVPILFLLGAAIFLTIDSKRVHEFVSKKIFNLNQSAHEKRWIKPIVGRNVVPIHQSEFKAGREWKLSELKGRFEVAMSKLNGKVILNGEIISDFETLLKKIHLDEIKFSEELLHERELKLEQVRSLQFLDQLRVGLESALEFDTEVEECKAELLVQGIESMAVEIQVAFDDSTCNGDFKIIPNGVASVVDSA